MGEAGEGRQRAQQRVGGIRVAVEDEALQGAAEEECQGAGVQLPITGQLCQEALGQRGRQGRQTATVLLAGRCRSRTPREHQGVETWDTVGWGLAGPYLSGGWRLPPVPAGRAKAHGRRVRAVRTQGLGGPQWGAPVWPGASAALQPGRQRLTALGGTCQAQRPQVCGKKLG